MDIRQSPVYAKYMENLGWKVEKVGKWNAFIKNFPIIGSFIKIQRISSPFPEKVKLRQPKLAGAKPRTNWYGEIVNLAKKHRAFKIIVEPDISLKSLELHVTGYKLHDEIYSPSKTIHIDLTPTEKDIFNRFSDSKRRAVRRAEKNKVTVQESSDIEAFIKLKSKPMFPLGFLFKKEINALWQIFSPKNASLLLAYRFNDSNHPPAGRVISGVLLLFWEKTAHYWLAGAANEGKKLFAPSLLVWEALKLAKKRGSTTFDFEGIYDPRFPKATKNWKGFTRFKEGFGGKEVEYPKPFMI